jgi:hypothetical protein
MRCRLAILLVVAAALPVPIGAQPAADAERARVIAALETLMRTGHPVHTDHGEGLWLQRAVDRAIARNDRQIEELAQRAASPLVALAGPPVRPLAEAPPMIGVQRSDVLKLPRPVSYTAKIFASVDGGPMLESGSAPAKGGTSTPVGLPAAASSPGLHHVRVQAHIVYTGAGPVPPPEAWDLPDVVYAIYDPSAAERFDARVFLESAAAVPVSRLDANLPDEPLEAWLARAFPQAPDRKWSIGWLSRYCEERSLEPGGLPRTGALCSVAYFGGGGTIGQVWIRTGRVELTDTEGRWLVEPPSLEMLRLDYNGTVEVPLSWLPELLAADPSTWPRPDLSVDPHDITATREGSQVVVSAIVRNNGGSIARSAEVYVSASDGASGPTELVVVDVPALGQVEIRRRLHFTPAYGVALVHAVHGTMHAAHESVHFDPTPEDAIAFRVLNAPAAPPDYAARIRRECGGVCRGY